MQEIDGSVGPQDQVGVHVLAQPPGQIPLQLPGRKATRLAALATLRKFLDKDPSGFFRRLMDAEHRYAALKAEVQEAAPGERVGMSTEKAVEVISNCLRRINAKRAAEDAELAKRPDAAAIGATLQHALTGALEREAKLIQQLDELRGRP